MPVWAWLVVVVAVPLVFAKLYDVRGKRHGHRPGTGEERPVDLTNYHPMPPELPGGPPSG